MAEADNSSLPQPPTIRYFCHKCNCNIPHVLQDYTCPTCGGGFIEELPASDSVSSSGRDTTGSGSVSDFTGMLGSGADQSNVLSFDLFDLFTGGLNRQGQGQGQVRRHYSTGGESGQSSTPLPSLTGSRSGNPSGHQFSFVIDARPRQGTAGGQGQVNTDNPVENMLYSFLTDLISGLGGGAPGTGSIPMLSNLGDYVWGRDGLDAIVTQLMNQMEGTGPPPLSTDKLENLQTITISQDQIDRKLQCSVCWEDFKLNDEVKQLECDHIYHPDCILPWLKLHATCPICRRDFTDGSQQSKDSEGPSASTRSSNQSTTAQFPENQSSQSNRSNVQPTTVPARYPANNSASSSSSNPNPSSQPGQGRGRGSRGSGSSGQLDMDFEFD